MFVTATVVSVALAAALAWSAVGKLSHRAEIVAMYTRVGVPEDRLAYLATLLLAGAAGLIAGLVWAPIGVAAAVGVLCYFVLAVGAHVRAHDAGNLATPLMLAVTAAIALALRLATM